MKDWCSYSPDGFLGVEWSLSCRAHDGLYDKGGSLIDKIKADIALYLDLWEIATLANRGWKVMTIWTYAMIQLTGTSTLGLFFWYKTRLRVT